MKNLFKSPGRYYLLIGFLISALILDIFAPQLKLIVFGIAGIGALPTLLRAFSDLRKKKVTIDTFNVFALAAAFATIEPRSAAFIVLMLTFADLLDWYAESRTSHAVRELLKLQPMTAFVERKGKISEIQVTEVRKEDVLVISSGSRIPVDGVVIFGNASVNESSITGESVPLAKVVGDHVMSGTLNESGVLKIRATHVGKESTIAQMAELINEAAKNKSRAEKLADRFAVFFLPVVIIIASGTYWLTRNTGMTISIFLVACADDMAVAIPLAMVAAIGQAAKRGVIVKGGVWLDAIGLAKILVLDKTGTLTYGTFEVRKVVYAEGVAEDDFWHSVGVAEKFSEHPIGRSLFREALNRHEKIADPDKVKVSEGSGIEAVLAGQKICIGNERMLVGSDTSFSDSARKAYESLQKDYGDTVSMVFRNNVFLGAVAVADIPRPEAKKTIEELADIGIERIIMFTGDNPVVAERVSGALGISEFRAKMDPEEKLRGLEELEKSGGVIMIGDGINDAPALARATVGIAMGRAGTAVAVEAADMVILTDKLSRIPEMIRLGRNTRRVIRDDMIIWLASNILGFALVLSGIAGPSFAAFYNFATDFFPLLNSARLFRK